MVIGQEPSMKPYSLTKYSFVHRSYLLCRNFKGFLIKSIFLFIYEISVVLRELFSSIFGSVNFLLLESNQLKKCIIIKIKCDRFTIAKKL